MLEKIMETYIGKDLKEEDRKEYKIEYNAAIETVKLKPAKYSCSTCGSYK
jgi:hypothetical protein